MKRCTKCGEEKALEEYWTREGEKRRSRCNVCERRYQREWRLRNLDAARARERDIQRRRPKLYKSRYAFSGILKHRYGISVEAFAWMLHAQEFRCANRKCAAVLDLNTPDGAHLDHCHATGAVRAVLCGPCNIALGLLREDPDIALGIVELARKCRALAAPDVEVMVAQ